MKKSKLCIITIFDEANIGNRLQNYALQQCANNYFEVVTNTGKNWLEFFLMRCKTLLLIIFKHNLYRKRLLNFYSFNRKIKKVYYSVKKPVKLNKKFDIFFAGSDQIWNFNFVDYDKKYIDYFTLQFVDESKRHSFSASIGINQFSEEDNRLFFDKLKNFKKISVREEQAKDYLTSLTLKNVICTFDPTIMLNKEEWLKMAKKPKKQLPANFILAYFLPKLDDERKRVVSVFCRKINAELIDVNDSANLVGPAEFLYLLNKSKYFFTNSFHGLVFSMIFDKEIKFFERTENDNNIPMNSRIDNFINKFSVEKNIFVSNEEMITGNFEPSRVVYDFAKLDLEKKKINDYLNMIVQEKYEK